MKHRRIGKRILAALLLPRFMAVQLLMVQLMMAQVATAALVASVDRTIISDADLVNLSIRASDEASKTDLDFSGIERDFDILDSGVSSNSSISIINGRTTSVAYKDYRLVLRPKRLGNLTIPALQSGNTRSEPISIRVQAQSQAQKQRMQQFVFFETDVDTQETWVQGQIIYSVRLFYSDAIGGDFPQAPALPDAIIENIENEKRYESIVDGRRYYVLEKKYAIFPQKSGDLLIPRERFIGTRGRGGMFSQRQRVTAVSESHTVRVNPVPASFSGTSWLPAQSLSINESWSQDPPEFRVGDPVNRTLSITALGVPHTLLPIFEDINLDGAKIYTDPPEASNRPSPSGVTATQITTLGIVPTREGELTLPEIRIPWWNTRTNREEITIIPAATYTVLPAIRKAASAPANIPVATPNEASVITAASSTYWQWATLGLTLLWIITAWQLVVTRKTLSALSGGQILQREAATPSHPDETTSFRTLQSACRDNNPQQAHRALFLWGKARFPAIHSVNDLITYLPALGEPVEQLQAHLFSGSDEKNWQGSTLLSALINANARHQKQDKKTDLTPRLNPA